MRLEEAIRYLEVYARASHPSLGFDTPLQGFRLAIKILRTLMKMDAREPNQILLDDLYQWTKYREDGVLIDLRECTECLKPHGPTHMVKVDCDIEDHYWYLCPTMMQPGFYTVPPTDPEPF